MGRLIVIVAAFPAAVFAQPPIFQTLGPGTYAFDVSADGTVVVGRNGNQAVRWTQAGMQTLGTGTAYGVSADGSTIGGVAASGMFRWSSSSGYSAAGSGWGGNWARLSGDGSTLVAGERTLWGPAGVSQLPAAVGTVNDLSADGSVVIGSVYTANGLEPMRWTQAAGPVGLGRVPGGQYDSTATACTPDGSIIYGIARGPSGYDTFRWTQETGMVALGIHSPNFSGLPFPRDATPDGSIIVGEMFASAFVWRMGAGPREMDDVLTNDFGINLNGYHIWSSLGVSADGRTVVGYVHNGAEQPEGFIAHLPWSIPAPGGATVLVMAGCVLMRRRR